MDFAVLLDKRVKTKESEIDKYLDLAWELKKKTEAQVWWWYQL